MAVVLKRNFTRSRNELQRLEPQIAALKNEEITVENFETAKAEWTTYSNKISLYETRRRELELAINVEQDLNTLVSAESEELYAKEESWLREEHLKLVQYEANKKRENERERREKEERDERERREKEQEEREDRREREE